MDTAIAAFWSNVMLLKSVASYDFKSCQAKSTNDEGSA